MSWRHGASGYRNYGCRCDICRSGWAASQRAYIQRRKARTGQRIVQGRWTSEPARPRLKPPGGDLVWPVARADNNYSVKLESDSE